MPEFVKCGECNHPNFCRTYSGCAYGNGPAPVDLNRWTTCEGCTTAVVCDRLKVCNRQVITSAPGSHIIDAPEPHSGLHSAAPTRALTTYSAARKAVPMATGLLDYFPDALADVARLSKIANDKHNPGEPLHWSREKSSDHADCIVRHMTDRGIVDDDGALHDTKVAWRALAQLQLAIERLRASGVQYPP